MNRASRRKVGMRVVNDAIKARTNAIKKNKQVGFGIVITNLMFVIIFWRWTWTIRDKRVSK